MVNDCGCPPLTPREVEWGVNADNRHTSSMAPDMPDEVIRTLIGMERCPMERRALERILNARHVHVVRV